MSRVEEQLQRMKTAPGFIAALDQSGGSTPGALRAYGIAEGAWSTDEEMFAIVHQMRSRIITSPAFTGARILGELEAEEPPPLRHDSSTNALIRRYRAQPATKS